MPDIIRNHPHQQARVFTAGAALDAAKAAMIMFHGRNATAQDILSLSREFQTPGMAYLAPQASEWSWWPQRFIAPIASNEPHVSSALQVAADLLEKAIAAGVPANRVVFLGFSQGACLALEFAARHPRRYGGVIGLSGALIEDGDLARSYTGSLEATPVFLGCSDVDPHIPLARVQRSAQILRDLDAGVDLQIYPGMGHTVSHDEVKRVQALLAGLG